MTRERRFLIAAGMLLAITRAGAAAAAKPAPDRDTWRRLQAGDAPAAGVTTEATAGATVDSLSPGPLYRTYDGRGNNISHPTWGAAGTDYRREASGAAYVDGRSMPPGSDRPSPRVISNAIVEQGGLATEDERGLATAIYEFGQFLDHDFGLAKGGSTESFDVRVPAGDAYFDPDGTGTQLIFLDRSSYDPATGTTSPRQQINTVTSFIDASQVYGSDATRAAWIRTFTGGRLKVRVTEVGLLLPLNDGTQANDNPVGGPATALGVAGDVRANEQPGLTTLHIAFLREHNRQARRLSRLHPNWDDEHLYQEARRIVGAEMQVITYNEFVPALIGRRLPSYAGYRSSVNPGLSNLFATAAYRFGHSQVGSDIDVIDSDFEDVGAVELADVFFNPDAIPSMGGIDPVIRYMAIDNAQRIDNMIVGPLRNFLFGPPGAGGFDLASLNIQRGRDHGLQPYNRVRADFGLRPVTSFSQITSNAVLAGKLQELYGDVNKIDAWVGILAEDHVFNSSLGATGTAVMVDQFTRVRDGDRFWYQNAGFSSSDLYMLEHTRLSDILEKNSNAVGLQRSVFKVCIADFNHSGSVNSTDRDAYMTAYDAGSENADLDENGVIDNDDLAEFLDALAAGCD